MIVIVTRASMAKDVAAFVDALPDGIDAVRFDLNLPDMNFVGALKQPSLATMVVHDALVERGKCPYLLRMSPVVIVSLCDDISRSDFVPNDDPSRPVLVHLDGTPCVIAMSDDPEKQDAAGRLLVDLAHAIRDVAEGSGIDDASGAFSAVLYWAQATASKPEGRGDG